MKRLIFIIAIILTSLSLAGCISKPLKTEKLRDLTFAVLTKEEIPEELIRWIEEKKQDAFRMTYEDAGHLYIVEGYGAQPKTGYRIEVTDVYETENAVYFHSSLLGPEKDEEVEEITTFPYVVAVTQAIGKEVVFD